jgi:putative colanic acid biosynthesis UDP-glucose lipid carrier transferase
MLPKGLLKEYSQILLLIMRGLDVAAIVGSGFLAYFYKFDTLALSPRYILALAIAASLALIIFPFFHIYESARAKGFWRNISDLMRAIGTVLIFLAGLAFLTKTGENYSREWFIWWSIFSLALLFLFRCTLLILLRLMRAHGWNERHVIIIGAGELATKLVDTVQQALWTGFRVVAIFDDNAGQKPKYIAKIPVLQTPENLGAYLSAHRHEIDEIWLTLPLREEARVKEILHELRHDTVTTRLMLDIFGMDLFNHTIGDFAGFPALNIRSTPMVGMNRAIKAIEDRVLASIILLLASPLFLLVALAVKWSSKGPVFYRQKRVGWNGKEFEMLKFRTMPVDAEQHTGPVWAKAGENRATKIGSFLRKTSLDEIPQFINVLYGDMSIVGPRPERLVFVEQFKEQIPRYMQKHLVKAGITGWAQINGWRGNTSLEKRIEYDLYYIENWSFIFDLKIIFLTLFQGFIHKNAY